MWYVVLTLLSDLAFGLWSLNVFAFQGHGDVNGTLCICVR